MAISLYWLIVELIVSLVAVSSSTYIAHQAKKLYNLSSYRTLKYFSYSFYFFAGALFLRLIAIILLYTSENFLLTSPAGFALSFLASYLVATGGLMLGYSIVRKYIHDDSYNKSNFKIIHILSLLIASLQSWASLSAGTDDFFVVSSSMVIALLFALITNYTHEKNRDSSIFNPFSMVVILSFLIFVVLILAGVLATIFPAAVTAGYAFMALIFLVLVYQVNKISHKH